MTHALPDLTAEELNTLLAPTRDAVEDRARQAQIYLKLRVRLRYHLLRAGGAAQAAVEGALDRTFERVLAERQRARRAGKLATVTSTMQWLYALADEAVHADRQAQDTELIKHALEEQLSELAERIQRLAPDVAVTVHSLTLLRECIRRAIEGYLSTGRRKSRHDAFAMYLRAEFAGATQGVLSQLYRRASKVAIGQRQLETRRDLKAATKHCFEQSADGSSPRQNLHGGRQL